MILYLVMKVRKWEDIRFDNNIFRIQTEKGDYGYCPVFADYKKAVEAAGDDRHICAIKAGE